MKSNLLARCFVVILSVTGLVWAFSSESFAQSGRKPQSQSQSQASPNHGQSAKNSDTDKDSDKEKTSTRALADTTPVSVDESGTIKMDTSLVTIPVSVIDRDGKFVPTLKKRDFLLYEDGIQQEIESLTSVEAPFHVVLALDTSNSTMFKLQDIQEAAKAFIKELRADDQVMVVSFDSKVRFHCDFTNDYETLKSAINETRTGGSTKLYEAVDKVVDRLAQVDGRKAIVLFTDGVDTSSRRANYQNTIEKVEESGALVYPIRYDTENDQPPVTQSGRGPGNFPIPTSSPSSTPLPTPPISRKWPLSQLVSPMFPQWPTHTPSGIGIGTSKGEYQKAARYLKELAVRSGGRLYEANTLNNVSQAFSDIANELRHQYALSYYPSNGKKDGGYRRVKVRVVQEDMIVRAREGYRSASDPKTTTNNNVGQNQSPEVKPKPVASQ